MTRILTGLAILIALAGCDRVGHIGKPPDLTPTRQGGEQLAMLDPGLPFRRVGRYQVHRGIAHRCDRRPLQPDLVEQPADVGKMVGRSLEDRNLDAVEAGRPDVAQQFFMLARDMRGPQEHAHADLHAALPVPCPMSVQALSLTHLALAFAERTHASTKATPSRPSATVG